MTGEPTEETGPTKPEDRAPTKEQVWSYRGYSLKPSEFTSALTTYYQAEIDRSNVWRQRLDATGGRCQCDQPHSAWTGTKARRNGGR